LEDAFKREIREEVGATLTDVQPLGIVREYRIYNDQPVINHTTIFSATVVGELTPLSLSEDEDKEGHAVKRVAVDEAKSLIRSALLEEPSYGATFVLNRELIILEEYSASLG
jgi:8-oxo-dGTP pyrophosphatase MutT (NUDIX family)